MSDKNNGKNNSDGNLVAIIIMVLSFGTLIIASILTKDHPFDFLAELLGMIVAYVLLISLILIILGVVFFYYRMADEDPDKPLSERARDSLEISKETSSEISQYVKKFYADYQERKKAADDEQK